MLLNMEETTPLVAYFFSNAVACNVLQIHVEVSNINSQERTSIIFFYYNTRREKKT